MGLADARFVAVFGTVLRVGREDLEPIDLLRSGVLSSGHEVIQFVSDFDALL